MKKRKLLIIFLAVVLINSFTIDFLPRTNARYIKTDEKDYNESISFMNSNNNQISIVLNTDNNDETHLSYLLSFNRNTLLYDENDIDRYRIVVKDLKGNNCSIITGATSNTIVYNNNNPKRATVSYQCSFEGLETTDNLGTTYSIYEDIIHNNSVEKTIAIAENRTLNLDMTLQEYLDTLSGGKEVFVSYYNDAETAFRTFAAAHNYTNDAIQAGVNYLQSKFDDRGGTKLFTEANKNLLRGFTYTLDDTGAVTAYTFTEEYVGYAISKAMNSTTNKQKSFYYSSIDDQQIAAKNKALFDRYLASYTSYSESERNMVSSFIESKLVGLFNGSITLSYIQMQTSTNYGIKYLTFNEDTLLNYAILSNSPDQTVSFYHHVKFTTINPPIYYDETVLKSAYDSVINNASYLDASIKDQLINDNSINGKILESVYKNAMTNIDDNNRVIISDLHIIHVTDINSNVIPMLVNVYTDNSKIYIRFAKIEQNAPININIVDNQEMSVDNTTVMTSTGFDLKEALEKIGQALDPNYTLSLITDAVPDYSTTATKVSYVLVWPIS